MNATEQGPVTITHAAADMPIDLFQVEGSKDLFTDEVFVPILLNPGMRAEIKKKDSNQDEKKIFGGR